VAVPDEFSDAGGEADAPRDPAKWAEGDEYLRADSCGSDTSEAAGGVGMEGTRGWRSEAGVFDLRLQLRGHEVRQVGGV